MSLEQTVSQRLAAVLPTKKLTVLTFSEELVPVVKADPNQRRLALAFDNCYYINLDSKLLPFLTIEENLFVGIKRKKTTLYAQRLENWQHFFKMEPTLNQAYPTEISHDRLVIIQLIRAFILEKTYIFIDDLELDLSEAFLASLMPILSKIAKDDGVTIVLLTTKTELANQFKLESIDAQSIL